MSLDSITVFNIGFSAKVDGPGQRMVVYFKGCNLRCPWCAAPESLSGQPEVLFYADRVDDPDDAVAVCPYRAVQDIDGELTRNVELCRRCTTRDCIASRHPAFELVGYSVSVKDIVTKAVRYRPFFGANGGVTIGGGEPTVQFDALRALLTHLKAEGIHTAIETNGSHPNLPELFEAIDLLYIDLKHPDPAKVSGPVGDCVSLNIAERHRHGGQMVVRIPFISGYNADHDTVHAFGKLLAPVGNVTVELLPYHNRASVKWCACGTPSPNTLFRVPTKDELDEATSILRGYDLTVCDSQTG